VGVLVSLKKKRKLLTMRVKETKKAKQGCFRCFLLASHGESRERKRMRKGLVFVMYISPSHHGLLGLS
jgi:hypothetical protein